MDGLLCSLEIHARIHPNGLYSGGPASPPSMDDKVVPVQALEMRRARRDGELGVRAMLLRFYTEWRRKGRGRHVSVRWLWRCGAVPNCRVLADARCDPRGRLVAVAVATGGGATPAAASRHSDSLTALHPPHLARRPFLVAGWLTDRQADHAPARPCHLRSASQHEGCRCHRRVGQGGYASILPGLHRAPRN